jgi:glycosyltransferase involved in cell wall biosynthesis
VCVGFNDWDNEVWTNQHHLMARLAQAGSRVIFVESLGLRRPRLSAGRDLRRIGRRLWRGLSGPRLRDGVTVLSPLVVPLHSAKTIRAANARLLRYQVGRSATRLGFRQPILWGYVPQAETLLDVLDPELVVYHCVDDIAALEGVDSAGFAASERRFVDRADLVLASSSTLFERMQRLSDHVLYAPNVADTALFASAIEAGHVDPALAGLPEPRVVFIGAVTAAKLDFELLVGVAAARRELAFALVGPIGLGDPRTDVSLLEQEPNIHLLGPRSHDALPAVLRGAAAGVIPYRQSRLTASVFPMKVYEFLAAGLPVVASGLPALEGVDEVTLVCGVEAMVQALDKVLAEDSPRLRRERSAQAQGHSWETRLAEIGAALSR